jgi:biotin operon repressor
MTTVAPASHTEDRTPSARTLEGRLEAALAATEREHGKLAALEQARPTPLTDNERRALARLARDLPTLWNASTTSDRDRKELLRTLIREVIVVVTGPEARADVEIAWEGGARSELRLRLNRRGPERRRTDEDTVELIRRLAAEHPDRQIAATLSKQGRRTGTGLAFTEARVRATRQRAGIPAAPPPDPNSQLVSIHRAASELGVSTATVRRWLRDGLLPGEQTTPDAPWRIRLTDEVRARFVPDIPDGFVALEEAARRLGVARQTVLHQVQRGQRRAIEVTQGRRRGLRIDVRDADAGLFDHL